MHSSSKKNLDEAVGQMSAVEVIRAITKAMHQQNNEVVEAIKRGFPDSKKDEANKLFKLYSEKVSLHLEIILLKAMQAVRFYNWIVFELFDLGKVEVEPPEIGDTFDLLETIGKKMEEIDLQSKGIQDFEEFEDLMMMEVMCNQWMKVAIKIATGYSVKTPIQDFDEVKSRLEQIVQDHYTKSR